jgi:hypothetical protein
MATCTVPAHDNASSGDTLYSSRACWQELVDWAWLAFGFQNQYWDDGFGCEDPCYIDLPLNRTVSAIWLLCYSAEDYEKDEYGNNCLHWARRYCWDQIDSLRSFCGDGSAVARASGSNVDVFLGYWYDQDVSVRASTLLHEARHIGGKPHDADFPEGSTFGGRWSHVGLRGRVDVRDVVPAVVLRRWPAHHRRAEGAGPPRGQRVHRQRLRHAPGLHHRLSHREPLRAVALPSPTRTHTSQDPSATHIRQVHA